METITSNTHPKKKYTRSVSFKLDWLLHTRVEEIASKTGMTMHMTLITLVDKGLETYDQVSDTGKFSPKAQLYSKVKEVHEYQQTFIYLAEIKWEMAPIEFNELCENLDVNPHEFDDLPDPRVRRTKRDVYREFLDALFYKRPKGLPGTEVLDLASERGFGENMTREVRKELFIISKKMKHYGQMKNIWLPGK